MHKLPIEKNEIRIGAIQNLRQAVAIWKFWVAGNEIYCTSRNQGSVTKISIHHSGQIHMHLGSGKQILARPVTLGSGEWLHSIEIRFLLSPDALYPFPENLKKKVACLIEVPLNCYAILNLLTTANSDQVNVPLPNEFSGAMVVWRTRLRSGQKVVLLARVMELDDDNIQAIRHIRQELRPKANFTNPLTTTPYIEIRQVQWSQNGSNIVLVIPMGKEAYE